MKRFLLFSFSMACLFPCAQVVEAETHYGTFKAEWHLASTDHVVIIIPGSGPVDRNGNAGSLVGNNLLYLADSLNHHGYSTLNTDKFNAAESKVDTNNATYDLFVDLAMRWIDIAVDSGFTDITLLGHSQGALTASIAGNHPNVNRVISLCGAGFRINDILYRQLEEQIPSPYIEKIGLALDSIRLGFVPAAPHFAVSSLFTPDNVEFLKSWDAKDPCTEIAKLEKPVLIIGGENDIQVPQEEGDQLDSCAINNEYVIIEGMGHMLKRAPGVRLAALPYYGRTDLHLHEDLAPCIVRFIEGR